MVNIKLFANYRETVGKDQIQIEIKNKTTLNEILNKLQTKHPELKKQISNQQQLKKEVNILINEKTINNNQINEKTINNNDTIALLPPVSGG
ncbi:Molybdopterin converting factor small subunit MoaD [Methanonatronarchaeum thermophilum]|uniref:Molybdopterin converting factor small subunit MoaD n=1 Tax=Methanonatronarchaeum thermophilum TaxID=1927129 RepID=A0A1Y3GGG6_9EURY|nr:ubiquitin-like small modifier protein 1 [Methanonatronarchaeum thermophilum]OUJ19413.1 Molybdopterin converting factor small subunit MoaD [Methanonatronarchaeum thermophilum]